MNEEQKRIFTTFIIDFENSIKECQNYLNTKETVTSAVFKGLINGIQTIVAEVKKDIDFLNKEELFFNIENTEKAYINNFVMGAENDIKSMLEHISNKQEVEFKVYDVFFHDFLCKIRDLKQNVKFLQGDLKYTIKAIKIDK